MPKDLLADVYPKESIPSGLRQQRQQLAATPPIQGGGRAGQRDLLAGAYRPEWFTGQNADSTRNGWDTKFFNSAIKQYDEALKAGDGRNFFERGNGVVTMDHQTSNGTDYKFGDVVKDGKVQYNLYDKFETKQADQMIAPWMLSGDELGKVFESRNPSGDLAEKIGEERGKRERVYKSFADVEEFQQNVKKRQDKILEGGSELGLIAAGGASTAATAAGFGAAGGPWAALGAAAVGFAVGAVGTALNRDALSESLARAEEITKLSRERHGEIGGFATGLGEYAGVWGKFNQPLSNIVQGSYDWAKDGKSVGDGEAEFYTVDKEGKRKAGLGIKALDVGATVLDSLLMFGSKTGRGLYMAQMTGQIMGPVGELVVNDGERFSHGLGKFDSVWTDDKGNFDKSSSIAGLTDIGIDVVQLGMARGIGKSVSSSRAAMDGGAQGVRGEVDGLRKFIQTNRDSAAHRATGKYDEFVAKADAGLAKTGKRLGELEQKLPTWAGGTRGLKRSEEIRHGSGFTVTVDRATGRAVEGSWRPSIALLAPSEAVGMLSTRVLAARKVFKNSNKHISADDWYQASRTLANSNNKVQMALLNGFGEGSEEFVQAFAEPMSHQLRPKGEEVFWATVYGGAAGFGMSLGSTMRAPSSQEMLKSKAKLKRYFDSQGVAISDKEFDAHWSKMTPEEQLAAGTLAQVEETTLSGAAQIIQDENATTVFGGLPAVAAAKDAISKQQAKVTAKATKKTDTTVVITQASAAPHIKWNGEVAAGPTNDSMALSIKTFLRFLSLHHEGLRISVQDLEKRIIADKQALAAATDQSHAQGIADLEQKLVETQLILQQVDRINKRIRREVRVIQGGVTLRVRKDATGQPVLGADGKKETYEYTYTPADRRRAIKNLNEYISRVYSGTKTTYDAATGRVLKEGIPENATREEVIANIRAVALLVGREPLGTPGSYQTVLPQVSIDLTESDANNVAMVSAGIVIPMGGDFDGDKFRQIARAAMSNMDFLNIRVGNNNQNARTLDTDVHSFEKLVIRLFSEVHKSGDNGKKALALKAKRQLNKVIHVRFDGIVKPKVLTNLLSTFTRELAVGNPNARVNFMNSLMKEAGPELVEARFNMIRNDFVWWDQTFNGIMQAFQRNYNRAFGMKELEARRDDSPETIKAYLDFVERDPDYEPPAPTVITRSNEPLEGATPLDNILINQAEADVFRLFQQFNYSELSSPQVVERLEKGEIPTIIAEYLQLFNALSQKTNLSAFELITGQGRHLDNVLHQLEYMAANARQINKKLKPQESLALVANMEIPNVSARQGGGYEINGTITLAQMLLRNEAQKVRTKEGTNVEANTLIQAKLRRWENAARPDDPRERKTKSKKSKKAANSSKTLAIIFGGLPMNYFFDVETEFIGGHLSFEQALRRYVGMSKQAKRSFAMQLKSDDTVYKASKKPGATHSIEEVLSGDALKRRNGYSTIVDVLLDVGNHRIALDSNGNVIGEFAEDNARTHEAFVAAADKALNLIEKYYEFNGTVDRGDLDEKQRVMADVLEVLEAEPGVAKALYESIPAAFRSEAITIEDSNALVADWVYALLTNANIEAGVAAYARNYMLAWWHSTNSAETIDTEDDPVVTRRQYDRLPNRLLRLFYRVRAMDDGGVAFTRFMDKFTKMKSIAEFERWVNHESGLVNNDTGIPEADLPFLFWKSDMADYDVNKASGGWVSEYPMEDLKENLAVLTQALDVATLRYTNLEDTKIEDAEIEESINLHIRHLESLKPGYQGEPVGTTAKARQDYEKLEAHLELLRNLDPVASPMAIRDAVAALINGVLDHGSDKGKTPEALKPLGQGLVNSQGQFGTAFEKVLDAISTIYIGDLLNHPKMLFEGVRVMDDSGRVTVIPPLNAEEYMKLYSKPATHGLAVRLLDIEVYENDMNGQPALRAMRRSSLSKSLNRDFVGKFFQGNPQDDKMDVEFLAFVEALASGLGGQNEVVEMLTNLVIARITGLQEPLRFDDTAAFENLVHLAMKDLSSFMKTLAQHVNKAAKLDFSDEKADTKEKQELQDFLNADFKALSTLFAAELKGEKVTTDTLSDSFVLSAWLKEVRVAQDELLKSQKEYVESEYQDDLALSNTAAERKAAESKRDSALAELDREHQKWQFKFDLISGEDYSSKLAAKVVLPKKGATKEQKAATIAYIRNHPNMVSQFVKTAPLIAEYLNLPDDKLYDPKFNRDKDWYTLSLMVAASTVDTLVMAGPSAKQLELWPELDRNGNPSYQEHWREQNYAWVLKPLFDKNSAVFKALMEYVRYAKMQDEISIATQDFLGNGLNGVLNAKHYGEITSLEPVRYEEAIRRLNTASAEAGVPLPGDAAKRNAAWEAATQRNYAPPEDDTEAFSKISFAQLQSENLFEAIEVVHPGGVKASDVRQQLNNSYATKIVVTDASGQPVAELYDQAFDEQASPEQRLKDLPLAGEAVYKDTSGSDKRYHVINLENLAKVANASVDKSLDKKTLFVEITFYHPDDEPADRHHSLIYEGQTHELSGSDNFRSLVAARTYSSSAPPSKEQTNILQSAKRNLVAVMKVLQPKSNTIFNIEAAWRTDFSKMIHDKVNKILKLEYDKDKYVVEPSFFKAVRKDVMNLHYVVGTEAVVDPDTGETSQKRIILSAREVIQRQRKGIELPQDARLYVISPTTMRAIMGELGKAGPIVPTNVEGEVREALIPSFEGLTTENTAFIEDGLNGESFDIIESRLANAKPLAPAQRSLYKTKKFEDKLKLRFEKFKDHRSAKILERHRDKGFEQGLAKKHLERLNQAGEFNDMSPGLIAKLGFMPDDTVLKPRPGTVETIRKALFSNAGLMFYTVQRTGDANTIEGLVTEHSIDGLKGSYEPTHGDVAAILVSTYAGHEDLLKKHIRYFADRGSKIMLVGARGYSELNAEARAYLQENLDYTDMHDKMLFEPLEYSSKYQNQKARLSELFAFGTESVKDRHLVLQVLDPMPITENAAAVAKQQGFAGYVHAVSPDIMKVAKTLQLLPTAYLGDYNIPIAEISSGLSSLDRARRKIQELNDESNILLMLEQANGHIKDRKQRAIADAEFRKAWAVVVESSKTRRNNLLPDKNTKFERGTIIPLIDSQNNMILYRVGYDTLNAPEVRALQQTEKTDAGQTKLPAETLGVAVFPSKISDRYSVPPGTVSDVRRNDAFGLEIEYLVELQELGDKGILQLNGMKYIYTVEAPEYKFTKEDIIPGFPVALVSNFDSAASKNAVFDRTINAQNAILQFGFDGFKKSLQKMVLGKLGEKNVLTPEEERIADDIIAELAKAKYHSLEEADDMISMLHVPRQIASALNTLMPDGITAFEDDFNSDHGTVSIEDMHTDAERAMALTALIYITARGSSYAAIERSSGFSTKEGRLDTDMYSMRMPRVVTQIFDNAPKGSALRTYFFTQLREKLSDNIVIDDNYAAHVKLENGAIVKAFLQFPRIVSGGANPIMDEAAAEIGSKQQLSLHSAAVTAAAIGATTTVSKDLSVRTGFAPQDQAAKAARMQDQDAYWKSWELPKEDPSFVAWKVRTPKEAKYLEDISKLHVAYRQRINRDKSRGWDGDKLNKFNRVARAALEELNLDMSHIDMFEFWIRQYLGARAPLPGQRNYDDNIPVDAAIEVAQEIADNINNGWLPVFAAEVPLMNAMDLLTIFKANQNIAKGKRWSPKKNPYKEGDTPMDFNAWVNTALGTSLGSMVIFDPLNASALDGFFKTYSDTFLAYQGFPVSLDTFTNLKLIDPDTNEIMISLSPQTRTLINDPMEMSGTNLSIESYYETEALAAAAFGKKGEHSALEQKLATKQAWRAKYGIPIPVELSMREFTENGAMAIDKGTKETAAMRMLMNLRVGNALISPPLFVSMPFEAVQRGIVDTVASLAVGESTGTLGQFAANLSDAMQQLEEDSPSEAVKLWRKLVDWFGLETVYTGKQVESLQRLYAVTGERDDFKSELHKDLMFIVIKNSGSKPERVTAAYARFATRMQDAVYGIRRTKLAQRYFEAAFHEMLRTGDGLFTIDSLIAACTSDPMFLKKNYTEAHHAGIMAVQQIRSLKSTIPNELIKGIVEPMAASKYVGVNYIGNFAKIPMMFSNYLSNTTLTLTGMNAFSDLMAAAMVGRKKGFIGKLQAAVRGQHETTDDYFSLETMLEGVDLARSVTRSGVTLTGWFTIGMMAGSLGLSGEDDEMRKRRRLAEAQGVGMLYSPEESIRDFMDGRNTLYAEWLPGGVAQVHWMFRQVFSPMIGFEKFFNTGNFNHVIWGFEDALGAFPLVNETMAYAAIDTARQLADKAADQDGSVQGVANSANFLSLAVGTLEKMLLENSFVNAIYQGKDEYDRDPYKLPLIDSAGNIQKDYKGEPRANDEGLTTYRDPVTGEIKEAYANRTESDASWHVLTENRFSLALIMNLFSGSPMAGDYWRGNMPIKLRTVPNAEVTKETAEAYIKAAVAHQFAGQPNVTADEIQGAVFNAVKAAGQWVPPDEIAKIVKAKSATYGFAPLSILNSSGQEELTTDGARAIFEGLKSGSVLLDDMATLGVYIDYETRQLIAAEWKREIIQEGLKLGLDSYGAERRMKRMMYGPQEDPSVLGLAEILFSKDIPATGKAVYEQLNTTYVIGPEGRPVATGFKRGGFLSALGLQPFTFQHQPEGSSVGMDKGLRTTTDSILGSNTGFRAVRRHEASMNVPTERELNEMMIKAVEDINADDFSIGTSDDDGSSKGGSGWRNYGGGWRRYGRRRRSYGGGGGYGGGGYFIKMQDLPRSTTPYANTTQFINTPNPTIRRSTVRRERVWAERGRLNQWQ